MASTRNKYHYSVRYVRRNSSTIKARRLWEASQSSQMDLLKEMKIVQAGKKDLKLPDTVEGRTGEEDIVSEFKQVYYSLYNITDDTDALKQLKKSLIEDIGNENSEQEIEKITGQVVKNATKRIKPGKGDVTGSYNSDMIINCPDSFFELLSGVFRSWLTHGTVSKSFLACAFLPLVKGLKDPSLTSSYRAVAGSSIILKLFDYVILDVWGDLLLSDSLQFGYKQGTSTTECSWLVTTVADYFRRRGSPVMMATLDAKQGFDRCSWIKIFESLRSRKLPAAVTRALIFIYMEQSARVRWGGAVSDQFSLTNSTRQGSVISPAIWCMYCEDLFVRLRRLGLGCRIHGVFLGVTMYADNVIMILIAQPLCSAGHAEGD